MDEETRQEYIGKMIENLPVLRAKLKLTQKDFADLIGVSNYSVSGMESGQRKMTWNTFMSILPVFLGNPETRDLLELFEIYTPELEAFLHLRVLEPLTDDEADEAAAAGVKVVKRTGRPAHTVPKNGRTAKPAAAGSEIKKVRTVTTKDPN